MYNINKSLIIMSCAFNEIEWNVFYRKKINKITIRKSMNLIGKKGGAIYIYIYIKNDSYLYGDIYI